MKPKTCFCLFVLSYTFFLFAGCAPISRQLREKAESLSFAEVFKNPEIHKGKIVIWGGEVIHTTNQKDKTSLMEVLQRPLDWGEEPDRAKPSGGRFLVLVQEFLDPHIYRNGKKVTVAGEIIGEKTQLLGQFEYRYPLLLSKEIYLWREYHYDYLPPYAPFPYFPGGYYGPWYYSPWYYGPWYWGYPYW